MSTEAPEEEAGRDAPARAAGDFLLAATVVAVCAWVAAEALGMPRRGKLGLLTSPGFTPLLVSTAVAVMGTVLAVRAVLRGAFGGIGPRLAEMARSEESRRVAVLFALMTGYVLLIGVVHFAVATGVFLLASFRYVRSGGWGATAVATAVGVLLTAVVIPYVFTMPLP